MNPLVLNGYITHSSSRFIEDILASIWSSLRVFVAFLSCKKHCVCDIVL